MAFIMLACKNIKLRLPGYLLLLMLFSMSCAASEAFNVSTASTRLVKGTYRLNAHIDYPLNKEVRAAVKSGVPLTVTQEIEMQRRRQWLWSKTIKHISLRYQLRYHALSEQFVLTNLSQGRQRAYPNLSAAIKHLGTLRDYPLVAQTELESASHYWVRLRTRLSIEDLPVPMRPVAYLSPQWHLDSAWFSWSLSASSGA